MVIRKYPVNIIYKNYKGEVDKRNITPYDLQYGANHYHQTSQWLLDVFDNDKQEFRTFAMADILAWGDKAVAEWIEENGDFVTKE